jgi:small subunit ribosomal protein S16
MGARKQPVYRVVVADSRSPRDGRFLDTIGTYNPRTEPAEIRIDREKALAWLEKGAEPTDTARSLLSRVGIWQRFRTGEWPAGATTEAPARPAETAVPESAEAGEAPAGEGPSPEE